MKNSIVNSGAKITVIGWTKPSILFSSKPQILIEMDAFDQAYINLDNEKIDELIRILEWAKSTKI